MTDTSPLHVHVSDDTPVHVHVKNPQNLVNGKRSYESNMSSRAQRSPASSGRRSPTRSNLKSPKAPWVPAPARTTRGNKVSFEGSRGTLELGLSNGLRRSDPGYYDDDSDDEKGAKEIRSTARARDYERRIHGLMNEVGTLREQVDEKEMVLNELDASQTELRETKAELYEKDRDNRRLNESLSELRLEGKDSLNGLSRDRENLLRKLIEAEMDGQEATRQATQLRDFMKRLRDERRVSSDDLRLVNIHREALIEKLSDFENTNKTLRRLLQDQHAGETEQSRLSEHKHILINKLAASEEQNDQIRNQMKELEKMVVDLKIQLRTQTDETLASATLQTSLEQTRAHLQRELRQREADCNRMAVQIRTLESNIAQEKIETDHLQELLRQAHTKHDRDKDALKKATRIQKQRASRSESTADQLSLQLLEKDQKVSELQAICDEQKALLEQAAREKAAISTENTFIKSRLTEAESKVYQSEDRYRELSDSTTRELHDRDQRLQQLRSETERLRTQIMTTDEKCTSLESECRSLTSDKREVERSAAEYRDRADRGAHENRVLNSKLDEASQTLDRVKTESSLEIERVRQRLEERLTELEPLPEMLKTAELKLHETTERLLNADKHSDERLHIVSELTNKIERQSGDLENWKDKYRALESSLQAKVDTLERRQKEVDQKNTELMLTLAQKDEQLTKTQYKLEEKSSENCSLARQLENSLTDSRRQTDETREKASYKERALQDRMRDLDEQLTASRSDAARARREKEEAERKYNSKLYDLKDRLEQSHATNRSMQNYVQFLKSSYSTVMSDVSASSPRVSPVRGSSTLRDGASFRQPQF